MNDLTLIPRISEKAFAGSDQAKGQLIVFDVPVTATKQMIAAAVKEQFEVEVTNVRTLRVKGKVVRTVKKRSRPISGQRKVIKKAYVTLGKDSRIAIIEEPQATKKTAKKETK